MALSPVTGNELQGRQRPAVKSIEYRAYTLTSKRRGDRPSCLAESVVEERAINDRA